MQKNDNAGPRAGLFKHAKIFIAMKLAILFTFLGVLDASASAYSQTGRLTLNMENASIVEVLNRIERLTDYHFIYSLDLLTDKKPVSLHAQREPLKNVLRHLLAGSGVSYKVLENNLIVVTPPQQMAALAGMDAREQDIGVSGTVTDEQGNQLAGVTVRVKGSAIGTVTDARGHFSIDVPGTQDTLVFTYVGYTSREVAAAGRTSLQVVLSPSAQSLKDVVVIGYQSVSKKDLTGAVSLVNTENSSKISSNDLGGMLQGLVAGVTVRNTGNPGAGSTIEIRGVGSFGNSSPLYVIDGMLSDVNTTVNTDDIASIQVLKDASAAAIYGSRAGNGVIIITTKKGKEGPAKISASAKYGVQQIPHPWDVMSAPQYLQTVKTEYQNSGVGLPAGLAAQLASPTINTDWQDAVYRTGNDQDYNLSVSGGSGTSDYLLSGSFYKNKGVLIGNEFQRSSIRINTHATKGRLSVGENMMISNSDGHYPGGGLNAFYEASTMLPTIAVQGDPYKTIQYNPAGWGMGTTDMPTYASNYVAADAIDNVQYNYAKIIGNAYASLRLTNWLSYKFNMGAEVSFDYHKEVSDTGIWRYTNQPGATRITEDRELFTNFLLEHTLNFNKSFGLSNINGVLGFSRTQQKRTATSAGRTHLQRVNGAPLTTINSANGDPSASGSTPVFWRSHGYLGRINYAYNDKYLVTLTGRIDQDSRFGADYRTGYFPSAAVAWRISKESFFHVPWINDLKLRGSYGKLGFSAVLGSWDYIGILNNNPRAVYGTSQSPLIGEYQAAIVNPDLHWETRIQKDVGFDAKLFDNAVSLTVDVYNSLSKDVLVSLPLPQYLGSVGSAAANAGSIRNSGVEVDATYQHSGGPFNWSVSANVTTIKNTVVSVGNQGTDVSGNKVNYLQPTDFIRAQVGHSIGEWYVIKTDGIFKSQQQIDAYVNKQGTPVQPDAKPGDVKYVDANGDGVINDGDRQFDGSPWPTLQAGAQFNMTYRHFDLNIQLVGVFGDKLYDDVRRVLDGYQLTNFRKDIDPWSPTHTGGSDPRLAVDVPGDPTVSVNNMPQTSRWLENGSYVRLRNVELGYTFSPAMLTAIGLSDLHLYVSGQNLLTLTGYKGMDPDVQGTGILTRGFDAGNWPASRIVSVGLNLGF
jgi:TonB-linked SusC/RagA family outer membrane protein